MLSHGWHQLKYDLGVVLLSSGPEICSRYCPLSSSNGFIVVTVVLYCYLLDSLKTLYLPWLAGCSTRNMHINTRVGQTHRHTHKHGLAFETHTCTHTHTHSWKIPLKNLFLTTSPPKCSSSSHMRSLMSMDPIHS